MARILVVDDSTVVRLALQDMLQKAGHEVVGTANNGREALERYRELKPDVVTLDILMDGYEEQLRGGGPVPAHQLDGLIALAGIRAADPKARVVIVSSLIHEEIRRKALALGARDFILKPFSSKQVATAVSRALID